MGQASRRRKGKGGSRSSTPTPTSTTHGETAEDNDETIAKVGKDSNETKRRHGGESEIDDASLMVLTSEKRRGIYECDYCHSDISQQPRIRCAVCSDFDLCLECFTTSDHGAMMARIKAANQTQTELNKDGIESSSIMDVAISSAAAHHEDHHGYRVCDSTRYPIFPTGRIAAPSSVPRGKKGAEEGDVKEEGKNDEMAVDGDEKKSPPVGSKNDIATIPPPRKNISMELSLSDDPKTIWTAEEDLRLINAIATYGLGNWVDIAEAIGGNGSVGKTPKRCMERYLDDYLGRYGHILPQWTVADNTTDDLSAGTDSNPKKTTQIEGTSKDLVSYDAASTENNNHASITDGSGVVRVQDSNKGNDKNEVQGTGNEQTQPDRQKKDNQGDQAAAALPSKAIAPSSVSNISTIKVIADDEDRVRTSKRRSAANISSSSSSRKKLKVVPTQSVPGFEKIWPKPYLPSISGAVLGKEVARDLSCKAELAFVKATLGAPSKTEADKIRQTWIDTKLGRTGAPTVLPPRPHDAVHLLGSELAGFMPRRGDFDVEWENDAEAALADMEFIRGDKPEDKELKLKVLQIYCEKLDEREKRKKFVLNRHLYDYRTYIQDDLKLPVDERDLIHRMRLFERFHTPDEHKQFITDILKAKRLRKEIAKLQTYRRIGIRSLAEAEMYELDKDRRQFHKKLEMDAKAKAAALANAKSGTKGGGLSSNASSTGTSRTPSQFKGSESLWKQYQPNDRKHRRSNGRSGTFLDSIPSKSSEGTIMTNADGTKEGEKKEEKQEENASTIDEKKSEIAVEEAVAHEPNLVKDNAAVANEQDDPMEVEVLEKKEFDMSTARCKDLLSRKELKLCKRLKVYPVQYLKIKKTLIHESMKGGLLNKDSSNSGKKTLIMIDVERRGNIIEFLVRAGWINRKLGDTAMRVVTPQPAL